MKPILYWLRRLWHKFRPLPLWCERCGSCGGHGGSDYAFDPSPSGVSLSPGFMWDWDPCEDCTGAGICPSCGTQLSDDDAWRLFETDELAQCPFCRWSMNTPNDWGRDDDVNAWPDDPFCDDIMYEPLEDAG